MDVSIVIPVYNSEKIAPKLYERLTQVFSTLNYSYEIIAIVDGCADKSFEVLFNIHKLDNRVKVIEFSRNFGHQIALTAGLAHAQGDYVAIIDDDLEDPPEVLPLFINKMNEGYDVVYGVRRSRKRSLFIRVLYKLFYRLLRRVVSIEVPYDSGDFCMMDKKVVQILNSMPESNRYLRGMRSWIGFKQIGVEYDREQRLSGRSGYTMAQYFKLALNAIYSFSYIPLLYMSRIGVIIALISFGLGVRVIIRKLTGQIDVEGWVSLFIAVLFFSGLQLFFLGIIGQYLSRVYDEVKQRPKFIINRIVGFTQE